MSKNTNTSAKNTRSEQLTRWMRIGSITLICLPLVALLMLLKAQRPTLSLPPSATMSANSASTGGPIATPDTSTSIEHSAIVASATTDTTQRPASSCETIDQRTPSKSGTEDGYWDGYYDGTARQNARQHFNDSSSYAVAAQRHTYSTHYAEGYKLGYSNGARTP